MRPPIELLDKYDATFRDLITKRVLASKESIKALLRLNKESDWDFLCAAMDIVGDASMAIGHVLRFGLGGPTKYSDIGERYLRLYGLLNATYIQQRSAIRIYKIMNLVNPRKIKDQFDALEITILRHKLAAHSTDYRKEKAGEEESYVPIRATLGDMDVGYVGMQSTQSTINLTEAIEAHAKLMIDVMDAILDKSIKTIYRGESKKQKEFHLRLEDLRIEGKGGLVIGVEGGARLVITVTGTQP